MATVNRGWLKRQMKKGLVEAREDGKIDYATGRQVATFFQPVEYIDKQNFSGFVPRKPNVLVIDASKLDSSCGCAYRTDDGRVFLSVHSNLSYEIRVREEVEPETRKTSQPQADFVAYLSGEVA